MLQVDKVLKCYQDVDIAMTATQFLYFSFVWPRITLNITVLKKNKVEVRQNLRYNRVM